MKRKQIFIASLVVLCVGMGIFLIIRSSKAKSDPGDEEAGLPENTPTIITVQTGVLKRMTLHRYVAGFGTVEPAPATAKQAAASAPLAAPSAGIVTKVNVVEGQHVEPADVLMELNSGTTTAENAAQQVTRQKELYAQQNTSLKNLQDAEAQLALLRVTAPLAGTVTRVNVKPGQAVDLTTVVAEIMDLDRLTVSAEIPTADAGELKIGEKVQIRASSFQPVDGQDTHLTTAATAAVSFVSPVVNSNNGTILVRAALPADSGLRPGQFVQIKIVTAVHTNCLAAPDESIVTDEKGQSVIALVKGDEAMQMPVNIGFRENGWVEVEGPNLHANDSVVTVGAYGLPEKTKIKVVNP